MAVKVIKVLVTLTVLAVAVYALWMMDAEVGVHADAGAMQTKQGL